MIYFFEDKQHKILAVQSDSAFDEKTTEKLSWLFGNAHIINAQTLDGKFIGPRREMITPWSTNAVEITQNMGISGIKRIEEYVPQTENSAFDPMLQRKYEGLNQDIFTVNHQPDPIIFIEDLNEYNKKEGLALNENEIAYLEGLAKKLGRKLTDSEVFGFSQVNSEHCRHKIFGGSFVIDGK